MASGYFGKYTGIVKDNNDDEKRGHLQISVPALFPPDDLVLARAALPFGYYFVPENEGRKIEKEIASKQVQVRVALSPAGKPAIKGMLVGGVPVFTEPLL